tara:strand:+ start:8262 stop:8399 length:138 start_codon:yes stop_codon:yes gene_type:complete
MLVVQTLDSALNQPRPGRRILDQPFDYDRGGAKSVLHGSLVEVPA